MPWTWNGRKKFSHITKTAALAMHVQQVPWITYPERKKFFPLSEKKRISIWENMSYFDYLWLLKIFISTYIPLVRWEADTISFSLLKRQGLRILTQWRQHNSWSVTPRQKRLGKLPDRGKWNNSGIESGVTWNITKTKKNTYYRGNSQILTISLFSITCNHSI